MFLELLLILFFLLFTYILARGCWRVRAGAGTKRVVAAFWGLTLVIFVAAAFASRKPLKVTPPKDMPIAVAEDGYITSQGCRTCHPGQHASWHASYHRTMTQIATPEAVIGDFDDVHLKFGDRKYELSERNGEYFIEMDDPEVSSQSGARRRVKRRVELTTGSHHMQVYWASSGHTRKLTTLPIYFLNDQQRWIPREAAFVEPPEDDYPAVPGLWNNTCIKCHTTHARPRVSFDENDDLLADSQVSEFGISCEACHGPGEEHAKLNRDPRRRYEYHFSDRPDDSIVNPSRLSHVRASQVCGQCHSVRISFDQEHSRKLHFSGSTFRPGEDLDEHENIFCNANLNRPSARRMMENAPDFKRNSFWDDGMVRVSGREYNGLIESPCFQQGELSCLSCHSMHTSPDDQRSLRSWAVDQLGPRMESNQACTQCHDEFEDVEHLTNHTHHLADSSGSSCYNCHMPHTVYGLLKSLRSHEIDVPRVSDTLQFGRPNACNLCHLDRTLSWSAQALNKWYGHDIPEMTDDEQNVAASVLWALKGDAGLRALAACAMEWQPAKEASGSDWLGPYLSELMNDPYDVLRIIAFRALRKLPGMEETQFDEFATEQTRADAIARIRESWQENSKDKSRRSQATLYDEDGNINENEFRRILEQRDNRPVFLAE